jgi:hypothetical protein
MEFVHFSLSYNKVSIEAFKNGTYKRLFADGRRICSKSRTIEASGREGTSMLLSINIIYLIIYEILNLLLL